MSENYVTVAAFSEPFKAEMARGRLESDGIPSFVTGDISANVFSGMGSLGGRVELRVPAEHLARAAEVLAECGAADNLSEEVRGEGHDEGPVWICSLCGDAVRAVLPICPACHTPRGSVPVFDPDDETDDERKDGIQSSPNDTLRLPVEDGITKPGEIPFEASPPKTIPETETDIELPELTTMVGDTMARRAFYAALFGMMLPFLIPYSMWVLAGLALYNGELSRRGMRHMYLAMFLNGLVVLLVILLCGGVVSA